MDVEIFESGKKKLPIRAERRGLNLMNIAEACEVVRDSGSTTWNTTKALKKRKRTC